MNKSASDLEKARKIAGDLARLRLVLPMLEDQRKTILDAENMLPKLGGKSTAEG